VPIAKLNCIAKPEIKVLKRFFSFYFFNPESILYTQELNHFLF
jgi:hypothetical protein